MAVAGLMVVPLMADAAVTWRCPQPDGSVTYSMKQCKGGTALDPDHDALKESLDVSVRERDVYLAKVRQEIERKASVAATLPWGKSPTKARICPRIADDMQRQLAGLDVWSKSSVSSTFADLQIGTRRWAEFSCDLP